VDDAPLGQLDFLYMPSRGVERDLAFYTGVMGAEMVGHDNHWKISVVQSPPWRRTSWARAGPSGRAWKSTKKVRNRRDRRGRPRDRYHDPRRGLVEAALRGLGVVFIAAGVVSFIHPGDTFLALAAVISFFLVFAGTFDIITAISARKEIEVWWLQLVGGIIELALGFWAAGYYGRSAILLVAWVAAFAIIRGVMDIVLAFRVQALQHASASA